jgi:hypothetical protein
MFLSSLISKLESDGTLADPAKLYSLANITTSSITTDTALGSIGALLDLASSVQGLKPHDIHFVTMPTVYDTIDPNRVDPAPGADALWTLVRDDQWLDGTLPPSGSQTPTPSNPTTSTPTVSPPTQTAATPDPAASPAPSPSPTPDTSAPTSLQDRPADQDICANLPTPNTNAASGG